MQNNPKGVSPMEGLKTALLYVVAVLAAGLISQIPVVSDFLRFLFATGEVLKWVLGLAIVVAFCSLPVRFILFVFRSICSFFRKK